MTKHLGLFGAVAIVLASACGDGSDSNNKCGDGELGGNERCDDGNTADGDGCSSTCTTEQANTCGDGTVDVGSGEQCDDGNTTNGDGCSSSCTNESPSNCGNGHIDVGETCDDSNTVSGDGCSAFCQLETGGMTGSCQAPFDIALTAGSNGSSTAHITGDTTNGMDHFTAAICTTSSSIGGGYDLQYKLVLTEKSNVTITATDDSPDLILRLTSTACDASGAMSSCIDDPERLVLNNLVAGTYHLDVDGYDDTEYGQFGVDVTVKPSLCGNGTVDPGETCDDSNNVGGDGCSANCHDEAAGACSEPDEILLEDDGFELEGDVQGDTSTAADEFAAASCDGDADLGGGKDVTYSFTLTERSDVDIFLDGVGGSDLTFDPIIRVTTAGCDVNTEVISDSDSDDGCTEDTFQSWNALPPGTYYVTVDGKTASDAGMFDLTIYADISDCGDSYVDFNEACDDGGNDNGDGCSERCFVESGFVCDNDEDPSVCRVDTCGDGIIDDFEQCDDHNHADNDGCTAFCQIDPLYSCSGSPSVCTTHCGNGVIDAGETCDDGDADSGDGCSSTCQKEAGYSCTGFPSMCTVIPAVCGDGLLEIGEQCEDHNTANGDGCSSMCKLEFDVMEAAEPNDTVAQVLTAGPHRIKGSFDDNMDSDLYTFTLTTATKVGVETYTGINSSHPHNGDGDSRYDCDATPHLDTVVSIYPGTDTSEDADSVEYDDDDGADSCSFIEEDDTLDPGTYTIEIHSYTSDSTFGGDYYIDLHFD